MQQRCHAHAAAAQGGRQACHVGRCRRVALADGELGGGGAVACAPPGSPQRRLQRRCINAAAQQHDVGLAAASCQQLLRRNERAQGAQAAGDDACATGSR